MGKHNSVGDPLDKWKNSSPLGTGNGTCDVKNGGGIFGKNAFALSKPNKGAIGRSFYLLMIGLIVIAILATLLILFNS